MAKYIEFGFRNKKLLLPFGVAFMQIIINILDLVFAEPIKNPTLDMIVIGLSELASPVIGLVKISSLKNHINRPDKEKYPLKKMFLHFFILFLIFALYLILNIFLTIQGKLYEQKNNQNMQNLHNSGFSSYESLEMIFICLVSIILLKYKYFIHHIISIVMFIVLCISIDLILDNFPYIYSRGALFIVLCIFSVLLDAIDYGYQKYMMDILFYPFWDVGFTLGTVNLAIFGLILIICLITGKEKSIEQKNFLFIGFYKYFNEVNVGIIIAKQLLNFILTFILNLFRALTILNFTPDYILISFAISRIVNVVIETKKYICLALFPFQFFFLLFYLEIIELKFCGLNKNTKKNIQIRGERELNKSISDINGRMSDISSRSSNASDIEIAPDYAISQPANNIINIELNHQYYELNEKFEE